MYGSWERELHPEIRNRLSQMSSSIHNALTNKTCLKKHPESQAYAMNSQGDGYAALLKMTTHYRHPKAVVDGRHTSAPKQRAGESISEYTVNWVTFLNTQGIFGQLYSHRYFIELYLQTLRTELYLVLRAPIESFLKQVPPNKPVYHTLTPAHIAATSQGNACRLGIEKLLATKDKDTHLFHNLSEGNKTDEDPSSALPSDDIPNDRLEFDVIRALESHSSCFLCDDKDHHIATCPQLTRAKGNDLVMRVCVAAVGPRRDSRPDDRPTPRKDARPRQEERPRPDRQPQKVRGLRDSDDRSSCDESVASDFQ
jgi:hypothetical protein